MNCSSAQRFQRHAGSLLFGHFTGDQETLQTLSLERSKLCSINGVCRAVQGLDALASVPLVAASERINHSVDRVHILGVAASVDTSCVMYSESASGIAFACDQSVATLLTTLEPLLVNGMRNGTIDHVNFGGIGRSKLPAGITSQRLTEEIVAGHDRSAALHDLAARSFAHAGGKLNIPPRKFSSMDFRDEDGPGKFVRTYKAPPTKTPTQNDWDNGPDNVGIINDGDFYDSFNTDMYGLEYIPWDTLDWQMFEAQTHQECVQTCDEQFNGRTDFCNLLAAGVFVAGLDATVGATIGAIWSGPGAAGVFVAGATISATAGAGTLLVCNGAASWERLRCYANCPR